MRTLTAGMLAHLATGTTTLSFCCIVTRTDGVILRTTTHARDIVISGWIGNDAQFNGTYVAADGVSSTNIATNDALDVDNLEVRISSATITEDDLRAGLWDHATINLFMVNRANLTHGRIPERCGWIGEVTFEKYQSKAELRGLMQALSRVIGELDSPMCRADLGDARCQVNLTPFTVTGTITGVNADGVTLYDTARAEAGPSGGIAITGVSNANPGKVTCNVSTLVDNQIVTISGVVGPSLVNTTTVVRNIDTGAGTFELGIDTSDTSIYPAYVSGGTVTPLGSDAGYFDYGKITFTSGLNVTRSMEVLRYVPGQWQLALPMPYEVVIGDTYSMIAGCAKDLLISCKVKFNNVVKFRGEYYLPGIDKLLQVVRST